MADRIRLTVEPNEAQLEYDRPSEFTVTVQNLTGQVDAFDLSVVGLSPQYVRFDPPRLSKFPAPERSATSTMTVTIPRRAKVPARRHVIGIKAQSAVDTTLARVEEVRLDFPAVDDLALEAVPRVVTSGGRGKFRVRAVNRGSVPKQIQLVGTDSEEAVTYTFEPPTLLVPPFGAVESVARVKARRPLSGAMAQRSLTIRSIDSVGQSQETQATFMQRPLLRKPVLRLGAIGAIGAAAVAAFLLTRPTPVTLDDYANQEATEVEVELDSLGLEVSTTLAPNTDVPAGFVIATTPAAGTEVDPGTRVIVLVSSGLERAAIEDLKTLTPEEVDEKIRQLRQAGFFVEEEIVDSTEVAIGRVISTSPPAGDEVELGDTIIVRRSAGIAVPDVIGTPVAAATVQLGNLGLTVVEDPRETDDETRDGLVIGQTPAGGSRVTAAATSVLLTFEVFVEPPETTTQPPPTTGGG